MKRWKDDDWDEGDERDADEFLDLEKKIYLEMFPYNKAMFEDKDEDEDIDEVEIVEATSKSPIARSKGKTAEERIESHQQKRRRKKGISKLIWTSIFDMFSPLICQELFIDNYLFSINLYVPRKTDSIVLVKVYCYERAKFNHCSQIN